ncbi:MAG TPA: ATP-binding protein [Edaphobacter sp.]|nr:ATP-binding protein [Edaphobacter sp.]
MCGRVREEPTSFTRNAPFGSEFSESLVQVGSIYDAFFTTKGTSGTGLGLWVTAGILARHRGSMHLRSKTTPGASGTAFTLIFPLVGAERE